MAISKSYILSPFIFICLNSEAIKSIVEPAYNEIGLERHLAHNVRYSVLSINSLLFSIFC